MANKKKTTPVMPEEEYPFPLVHNGSEWGAMCARIPVNGNMSQEYMYVGSWIEDNHPIALDKIQSELEPFAGEVVFWSIKEAQDMVNAGMKFHPIPSRFQAPGRELSGVQKLSATEDSGW